jgi:DNA-binding CsgD family transcriptional regulator
MMSLMLESGFVGRERECAALCAALAHEPAMVLVEGEAGIGKTRLLREVLTQPAGDGRVNLLAGCPPFREPHTLAPIVDAVRASTDQIRHLALSPLAGALRPLFPEWSDHLPPMPEPLDDIRAAQYRLFRALLELLRCLDVRVLAVEDLHWADDATVEFLLFLTNRQPYPLSVVGTFRPGDVPSDSLLPRLSTRHNAVRITVQPLDIENTAKLVSTMLGGETVSAAFAAFLHERTAGIPLLTEESVRLLHDRGELVHGEGGWMRRHLSTLVVPPTVRDAVLERARHLDPPGCAVLDAAAVLNHPADEATLAAVSGQPVDEVRTGLRQALSSGLLREADPARITFCHALAALAVHDAIPGPHRRDLHQAAARVLTDAGVAPARLAHHHRNAGNTAEWCRHAEQAADAALASADESTATTLLYDVVAGADLPSRTLARLVGKIPAETLTGTGRCATLRQTLLAALDHDLAPPDEAELRFQLSQLLRFDHQFEASHSELARAVEHLGHDPVKAAYAMARLGHPSDRTSPVRYHLDWLNRAAQLGESLDPVHRTTITVSRMEALLDMGEPAGWALAEQVNDVSSTTQTLETTLRVHINVAYACTMWGRYSEARQRLTFVQELVDADVYPGVHALVASNLADIDWATGRWAGLATRIEALRRGPDLGLASGYDLLHIAGNLKAAAGLVTRADEELGQALSGLRAGVLSAYLPLAGSLARLRLATGQVADALAITDEPVEVIARKEIWLWAVDIAPVRVEALLATGRKDEAVELTDSFARWTRGRDVPTARAAVGLCQALLADARREPERAAGLFSAAAACFDSLPSPYRALLARERQALALIAADQADVGLALLGEVHAGLSTLGAAGTADRVALRLREHDVDVPRLRRGGRPSYGDQLSPREFEVVGLVIDGLTNQQIAEKLVLSRRTVGTHVESAMRKLQVSSRTALAVHVVESGLITAPALSDAE